MRTYKRNIVLVKDTRKRYVSYSLSPEEKFSLELYAAMILDEACYNFHKKRLEVAIDEAIGSRDEAMFMSLTESYNQLVAQNT
ncbi:IDEAL domain-containing protein [Bacillus timonensis]|nr:IDEAL domain-containing protein [Bacillus timonensis]